MAEQVDNLKKYGLEFQTKCVSALVIDKSFLERIFDLLKPEYFETDANKWIVSEIVSYFLQYKDTPTLNVFKVKIDPIDQDILKKSVVDQLRNIYMHIDDSDIPFVKEQFLEFCKNR